MKNNVKILFVPNWVRKKLEHDGKPLTTLFSFTETKEVLTRQDILNYVFVNEACRVLDLPAFEVSQSGKVVKALKNSFKQLDVFSDDGFKFNRVDNTKPNKNDYSIDDIKGEASVILNSYDSNASISESISILMVNDGESVSNIYNNYVVSSFFITDTVLGITFVPDESYNGLNQKVVEPVIKQLLDKYDYNRVAVLPIFNLWCEELDKSTKKT